MDSLNLDGNRINQRRLALLPLKVGLRLFIYVVGQPFGLVASGVPRSILAFSLATPNLEYAKASLTSTVTLGFSASPLDLAFYEPRLTSSTSSRSRCPSRHVKRFLEHVRGVGLPAVVTACGRDR